MAREHPSTWDAAKIEQAEAQLKGMQRRFAESNDPNLRKGISTLMRDIDIAKSASAFPPDFDL